MLRRNYRKLATKYLAAMAVLFVNGAFVYGQVDVADIIEEWTKIQKDVFVGRIESSQNLFSGEVENRVARIAIGVGTNCFWEETERFEPSLYRTTTIGMNSKYSFTIRKETGDGNYHVEDLVRLGNDPDLDEEKGTQLMRRQRLNPTRMTSLDLSLMLASTGFVLERIGTKATGPEPSLELIFSFNGTEDDGIQLSRLSVMRGSLILMGHPPFLPLRMETTESWQPNNDEVFQRVYQNEYAKNNRGAHRLIMTSLSEPQTGEGSITRLHYPDDGIPIPESECMLAAFGLPEPEFPVIGIARHWVWWSVGGGVGILALGVYLWHRRESAAA